MDSHQIIKHTNIFDPDHDLFPEDKNGISQFENSRKLLVIIYFV